jgi:hypothetical protein
MVVQCVIKMVMKFEMKSTSYDIHDGALGGARFEAINMVLSIIE